MLFALTCRHRRDGVTPSVKLRRKILNRSRVAALRSQVHGRRSARAAKNCRQSVGVHTVVNYLQFAVPPSDRSHVSLTHIPPRPQLPSPRFSLQNPFSIRARCSKDPESLAAARWDSHHSLNENMRGGERREEGERSCRRSGCH